MIRKITSTMALIFLSVNLMSCSSFNRCSDALGFNPVYDSSCKVRIRNVYLADNISPELKARLRDNPETSVQWVNTVNENNMIIPAHFIILNGAGMTVK